MILIGQVLHGLLPVVMIGTTWGTSRDSMRSREEKVALAWEWGKVRQT